jgi:hypothetical protein
MDESRLRDPAVLAANWWRIAQHDARLSVLRRLGLAEELASSPWQDIGPGVRDQITRETVSSPGS